jgi:uncharacterized membrane protein
VRDKETDETLGRAAQRLPSTWVLVGALVLVCAAVALAGAAQAGFYGIEKLTLLERALIFPIRAILMVLAGLEFVCEMIPRSLRRMNPGALLGVGCLVLLSVFAFLIRCCSPLQRA